MYCSGKQKAIVILKNPQERVIVAPTPVTVTCISSGNFEIYSHDTKQAINKTFDKPVASVELLPAGQTYNNGSTISNPIQPCPIPTISGNTITSNFDNYYPDNVGTCTYKVYFAGNTLTIKDGNNQIVFQSSNHACDYEIACDDQCPEGQTKIPTIEYPGYKCLEKCPPETCCECDCGDVICCYGSQGQVLKTIPK